ncbi:hypothetical protein DPMN_166022 [Dreissena polymorpha]|uniref:Uncharacterized protein n=1 Tax=Dreissena polymorpha TaxID=45954 RepID=A0A9D4EY31_DREPO|nr:hypothetical protein DPMN_166022 [Dreissena polymorpha]
MTEEMQTPWTLSATFEQNSAMQDFTELTFTTSRQHKDSTEECIKRDSSDLEKMQTQITTCSPYTADLTLRNIVNGIVAGSDMNVCAIEAVWETIIRDSIGKSIFAYKFTGKYRAKANGNSFAVKIASDRAFYPALLFQRFLVVSKSGDASLLVVLSYELSFHPASFFEAKNILFTADKPQIATHHVRLL